MAANTSSPKRVAFEDVHSSTSDEDRDPVEVSRHHFSVLVHSLNPRQVVFDDSNPYRRKSSMVATESIPPHLRRAPVPPHKTECLVHQFLANQQRLKSSTGDLHPNIRRIHHHDAGTAACEAEDISSEAGLDKPIDPKGDPTHDLDQGSDRDDDDDNNEQPNSSQPLIIPRSATPNASDSSASPCGQSDEKQWQAEMAEMAVSHVPSQLDRRSTTTDTCNSRLLTKKQLSEMAWGVRELSRRLGSMRLKFRVKSIFLLTKMMDAEPITHTRELCRWLLDKEREVRYTVYVGRELKGDKRFDVAGLLEEVRRDYVASGEVSEEASWDVDKRLRYWDDDMCKSRPHTFDFVITLGGDGTVLYASWLFQRIVPPVLSFALGSLGFLTKFDFGDFQKTLSGALNEGVTVSLRLRFEATVMRSQKTGSRLKVDGEHAEDDVDGGYELGPTRDLVEELIGEEKDDEYTHRPDATYEVLNEVVVDRGPNPSKPPISPTLNTPSTC
jgi:NAD+ kinase